MRRNLGAYRTRVANVKGWPKGNPYSRAPGSWRKSPSAGAALRNSSGGRDYQAPVRARVRAKL